MCERTEASAAQVLRVRLWCRDCGNGQDPMGCFDGGTDFLYDGLTVRTFATLDEAKSAGEEYTFEPPWEFEVINEDDEVLYDSYA